MTSSRDRFGGDVGGASEEEGSQGEGKAPGKRPLTLGLTVQRKVASWIQRLAASAQAAPRAGASEVAGRPTSPAPVDDPFGLHLESVATPVQRTGSGGPTIAESVTSAAAHGVSGPGGALPHAETIQRAFGHHDVSGVVGHVDEAAAAGAQAMGAQAFATGDHVAFAGTPDLHTAAHEAAHVVQQRGGVSLKGGVGAEGDEYEQHADAVADAVVAGRSAEGLLDRHAPGGGAAGAGVQMKIGANQPKSTKVRVKATGATGVITGTAAWGQYEVTWDKDGTTALVKGDDDAYEVVKDESVKVKDESVKDQSVKDQSVKVKDQSVKVKDESVKEETKPKKKPEDRDLDDWEDEDFQKEWLQKQDEVYFAMQQFVPRFLQLDSKAEVRVRGSIATGVKANPDKVHPDTRERLLFNPTNFDIDAYVASDALYQAALKASGTTDKQAKGKIPGSKLPSVNKIIKDMRSTLAKIAGNRDAPKDLQFRFNVLIRSFRNDEYTMELDDNDFGAPMTIDPPKKH